MRARNREIIIAGDFNAKAAAWGSPVTDNRGEHLMDWAAELSLNVINADETPTFERRSCKSFIDITWATDTITRQIQNWKVITGEFHTDHNYIYYEIGRDTKVRTR
ncbi:Endonuclease-reverse transcriptase [Popillia japonica]|uniref:Endonuclease-reverse transcriptase n=1 Tax=Popillia japonica TaxID=7064 RepID=A0AAW1JE50_POPJA